MLLDAAQERLMIASPVEALIADLHRKYPTEEYVALALDRKLRLRGAGAYSALALVQLQGQLRAFLAKRIDGDFDIVDIKPLTGGTSKEQFSFILDWQDGATRRRERLVLRTQANQSPAETHRLREFQLMDVLQGVVPLPRAMWIDPEGEEFSNPTLISSFSEGVSRAGDGHTDFRLSYAGYRETLAPQFADMLARIHNAEIDRDRLSAFEVPPEGSAAGVIQSINWWARVWEEDSVEREPLVTLAMQWLRENAPPIDRVSIVHGDYRSSNFLFSKQDSDIRAILDWELAWLGDRHFDLAYAMQPLAVEVAEDGRQLICGLMTREEFLAEYSRRSALPIDPVRLAYYELFVLFRNICTTNAGGARCVHGQNSHQDATLSWFVPLVGQVHMTGLRRALDRQFPKSGQSEELSC